MSRAFAATISQARRKLHSSSCNLLPDESAPQFLRKTPPITKRRIPHVKKVVLVASGKGGVGKSTVAANLSASLSCLPHRPRIGLLDLDIYGPSIPTLLGFTNSAQNTPDTTSNGAFIPLQNHGIKCMSIGFLTRSDGPVVWRGLMVQKATQQLLFDVDWRGRDQDSALDCLVVDMPPGTGDVQLTIAQLAEVNGAVVVSTPQDVALLDAKKGISMFRKVGIPTLGLVLNQAYYECSNCSVKHRLYGTSDAFNNLVAESRTKSLGELPLTPGVSESSDQGVPEVLKHPSGPYTAIMKSIAETLWKDLNIDSPTI